MIAVLDIDKAAEMNIDGRDAVNVIGNAGTQCSDIVMRLGDLCADEDYKEEIVKVTTLECIPADIQDSPVWSFNLNETTIEAEYNPVMSAGSDGAEYVKSIF